MLDRGEPEAMYALLPAARGCGVATRVLATLRDWAADHGRSGVTLVALEGNAASAAVARRAGFILAEVFEGQHRGAPHTLHRWRWEPATRTAHGWAGDDAGPAELRAADTKR